jgi:uncharacterized protein YgiM (DUF1202 family)
MFTKMRLGAIALAGVAALAVPAVSLFATSASAAVDQTAATYKGKVTASSLAVRSLPTTVAWKRGVIAKGRTITIVCKVRTVKVDGNDLWYLLAKNRWVSARYVSNLGKAPEFCGDVLPVGTAIKKPSVNLRQKPTNASQLVGTLKYGTGVELLCKVNGPTVGGNPRWYQIYDGRWVTARYIENFYGTVHYCSAKLP